MARIASGCEHDALDIVQDAMMTLVKSYSDKDESDWHGLFYRILQSRIYDYHRRNVVKNKVFGWLGFGQQDQDKDQDNDPIQQAHDHQGITPEFKLQLGQASQKLIAAVEQLPIRQQQTFLLRLWEGMSVAETAIAMSISEGSVKTHYSRALSTLRQQLEDYC